MAKKQKSVVSGCARPDFKLIKKDAKNYTRLFRDAMYYAHYEFNPVDLKKETLKYCKNILEKNDYDLLDLAEDFRFTVVGKYCYLLNHGSDIDISLERVKNLILEIKTHAIKIKLEKEKERAKEKVQNNVISIQDRLKEYAYEVCAEIDGWIDEEFTKNTYSDLNQKNVTNLFKSKNVNSQHARYIAEAYKKDMADLNSILDGTADAQIQNGYSNITKTNIKHLASFLNKIIDACNFIKESKKAERKPRKPKALSKEKLVAKLKFLKESSEYGIVSEDITNLIGAKEVWVFNTKNRKLGRYVAMDITGLSVKGTTLQNFSSDSIEKTLRKPKEQLKEFKTTAKSKISKFLETIATIDTKLNGRISSEHVILKILK